MAVAIHTFLDEQIEILEAELRRGFIVALVLGGVALALLVAAFLGGSDGPATLGIPASIFNKLVPGGGSFLAAAGTQVPLKLITPIRRKVSALRAAKALPDKELREMFKKAAEKAMQGGAT